MINNRFFALATISILTIMVVHNCTFKVGGKYSDVGSSDVVIPELPPFPEFKIESRSPTKDNLKTTEATPVKKDTSLSIEDKLSAALAIAEESVHHVVEEKETLQKRVRYLTEVKTITVYDTIEVIVEVPSDSVMVFNIFEYETSDGLLALTKRDTIQSRLVTREYVQKYVTQ